MFFLGVESQLTDAILHHDSIILTGLVRNWRAVSSTKEQIERCLPLGLLNDFRKFDYGNFLSFSFWVYRNRISFPTLRCATVLTNRDRPISISYISEYSFTALMYRCIRSPPIPSVIIISSNLTRQVKQADGLH